MLEVVTQLTECAFIMMSLTSCQRRKKSADYSVIPQQTQRHEPTRENDTEHESDVFEVILTDVLNRSVLVIHVSFACLTFCTSAKIFSH